MQCDLARNLAIPKTEHCEYLSKPTSGCENYHIAHLAYTERNYRTCKSAQQARADGCGASTIRLLSKRH
jgi:hypothetical protein